MRTVFSFFFLLLFLVQSYVFALPTGETKLQDIPSFQYLSTAKGLPVGESPAPRLKPTNVVLFSKVLESRIPARYKNNPGLVKSDIQRVFKYRQEHNILGTQKVNGQVVYDFYIGVLGYQVLTNVSFSRSFTTPHGGFIFVCVGSETSTITAKVHQLQIQNGAHKGDMNLISKFQPKVNGLLVGNEFVFFGNSGYADNFHELGHVLNIPCSHANINDLCTKGQKSVGLSGVYIDREGEFVNVLSMLRATAYNDLGIDVDKLDKEGYKRVLEAIMGDSDYDVKHGREFGRIKSYITAVGIDKFLRVAEPYLPAIL